MHTQISILGEYWTQDMKNEKHCVVVVTMFLLCSFYRRYSYYGIDAHIEEQGTTHIEAPSGFIPSYVKLKFQTQNLHDITSHLLKNHREL
jgi:hypothetical protein